MQEKRVNWNEAKKERAQQAYESGNVEHVTRLFGGISYKLLAINLCNALDEEKAMEMLDEMLNQEVGRIEPNFPIGGAEPKLFVNTDDRQKLKDKIIDKLEDIFETLGGYNKKYGLKWLGVWKSHTEQQENAPGSLLMLPDELYTDEAVKVFENAIKAGYMAKHNKGYKWNKSNALLAYMCGRLFCGDSIVISKITRDLEYKKGGYKDFPEAVICTLFNVKNLGQSRRQLERPPKGYNSIDKLF